MAYDFNTRRFAAGGARFAAAQINHALDGRTSVAALAEEARLRREGDEAAAAIVLGSVAQEMATAVGAESAARAQVDAQISAMLAEETTTRETAISSRLSVLGDASQVSVRIPGALLRLLVDRMAEVPRVTDYPGVYPNGGSDSTAGFRAALLANAGRTLLVPRGSYRISGTLSLADRQRLVGEGPNSSILVAVGSNFDVVSLASDFASVSNLGFTSASKRTGGAYIRLPLGTKCNTISDLAMLNAFKGVWIEGYAVITHIDRLDIRNTCGGTGIGIHVQNGNDTFIGRIVMDNDPGDQPKAGIYIQKSFATWITDCDLIHSGKALLIAPLIAGDEVMWCFIEQLACDTSIVGIAIEPAAGLIVKGVTFMNSWSATNALSGFVISGAGPVDGVQLLGHRSVNNGQSGYVLASPNAVNTAFLGCIASGNSAATPGLYSGFDVGSGVKQFQIQGCTAGAALGFSGSQNRGVLINPGASTDYIVTGNTLLGNTVAMFNGATGSGIVSANIGLMGVENVTVGATPFNVTARQDGRMMIEGGTVTGLAFKRGATVVALNPAEKSVAMCAGDLVSVNYTVVPTMTFIGA